MSDLPLWPRSPSSHEPFSPQTAEKASRLRGATVTEGVCPYCAVGCGQLIYTKGGQLIDIEGNPESPDQRGHALPQGRQRLPARRQSRIASPQVLYRAPYSDHWETRRWTGRWTRSPAASRRRATPTSRRGTRPAACSTRCARIGTLGGATIDNEENYLIKKLFGGGLGVVSIENQARI